MAPTVSVVVPTYNRSHLLSQAIVSVLSQDYKDFELIVVDDGSTDDTAQVVANFSDPRVRYFCQENSGLSASRNRGISESQGEYVTFLDDDDLYFPYKLSTQVAFMDANRHIGWSAGGHTITDLEGHEIAQWLPWLYEFNLTIEAWLLACATCPAAVMVNRVWLLESGSFDAHRELVEDWDLWLRLAYAGCQMAWIPKVLCKYRVHNTNMTQGVLYYRRRWLNTLDKFYTQHDLPNELILLQNEAYARAYLLMACREFAVGLNAEGQADMSEAVNLAPKYLANDGSYIVDTLCAEAEMPHNTDGDAMILAALAYLPQKVALLPRIEQRVKAKLAMSRLVAAAGRQNGKQMRHLLYGAVRRNPALMRERNFWVLGLTAVAGETTTRRARSAYRQVFAIGSTSS